MYYKKMESPIGELTLIEKDGFLTHIIFEHEFNHDAEMKDTSVLLETEKQLNEYFEGKRKEFDLPTNASGTGFQKRVWNELKKISYGSTCTYKDIAIRVGNDKASRAVGLANNRNPLSIIVPCHRVVGSNKKLVGYAGGLDKKELLINLEANNG